jgi:hypothetical protein
VLRGSPSRRPSLHPLLVALTPQLDLLSWPCSVQVSSVGLKIPTSPAHSELRKSGWNGLPCQRIWHLGLYLVVLELLEFFYIFKKPFCKNIRRCENFTLLTSAVAHSGFSTDDGMEWPSNRRGSRRLHVAYCRDPWRLVFLINERKHTIAMACTVLVLRDKMP